MLDHERLISAHFHQKSAAELTDFGISVGIFMLLEDFVLQIVSQK